METVGKQLLASARILQSWLLVWIHLTQKRYGSICIAIRSGEWEEA